MEVAKGVLPLAAKGGLGDLSVEHRQDLLVRDVAHLMVLVDDLAVLVADAAIAGLHESIAGVVLGANVAVDAGPSIVAVAGVAGSHGPILASGQRAASYMTKITTLDC